MIALDDQFIFNYTPTYVYRALGIKIPLEYLIEEKVEEEEENKCFKYSEIFRKVVSYFLLVRPIFNLI